MNRITVQINPKNCHFGSAPAEFWKHADFSRAWIDGTTKWQGTEMNYLHVPCHVEDEGKCQRCDYWGWPGTSHRLWPKWWPKNHYCGPDKDRPPHDYKGNPVLEVRLKKTAKSWLWILTLAGKGPSTWSLSLVNHSKEKGDERGKEK